MLILESILTTVSPSGEINVAPMGARLSSPDMARFLLRPYMTSRTYRNLKAHGEGVLHVTDDVMLLARAALGDLDPVPRLVPAAQVQGWVLHDACRWYEFQVLAIDDASDPVAIEARVVHTGRLRDFFGFNRAKHAVVEAAILATRTDFLPMADLQKEFQRLASIVNKTAGDQELRAFQYLRDHLDRVAEKQKAPEAGG